MPSLTHAVGDFVNSIFSFFKGIITSILALVQHFLHLIVSIVEQIAGLAKDVVSFLMHNAVIIGVLFAAFVAYSLFAGNKAGTAAPNKKRA
ncbi:BZ3500_MvSof-1268-A1-R1_Chr8-2g10151 [Microbotryum saponariae]|uniref:BZ3500_MvSof-1268-A1-R1_Chr8-2g10151 protein n=1 Tax=Microbotryum saponariae TaxID=289078 RepID=A0A2X0NAB5_9BASI|nr:BZ3500_MvSof-1268-A1-R1_Chr8-2g10151 [Microbotryum saponariae]SDA01887.1 BZ3501_MvSof-1269-A2-R1_Chr8-2g09902 [Microbotryum saponariae]